MQYELARGQSRLAVPIVVDRLLDPNRGVQHEVDDLGDDDAQHDREVGQRDLPKRLDGDNQRDDVVDDRPGQGEHVADGVGSHTPYVAYESLHGAGPRS